MTRYILMVSYIGHSYSGWQAQSEGQITIQATLEHAVSKVANHSVRVVCCGRTDAGVHALGQVVHFDSSADRATYQWVSGINANLPGDIRILGCQPVEEDFSARFSCKSRSYRYVIWNNSQSPSPWQRPYVYFHPHELAIDAMQEAASCLVGTYDFSAFRVLGCQARTTERTVINCSIERFKFGVYLDITANAFLYHMVRIIIGDLLMVGRGLMTQVELLAIRNTCMRKRQMRPLPACGLAFISASYGKNQGIKLIGADYPFALHGF